mgnify:CR=1 FL=1
MTSTDGEYAKQEDENAPTIMWAAWDDEAGIVTEPVATELEASADLGHLLAIAWRAHTIVPADTRLRQIHIHDDGLLRPEDPADECPVCAALAGQALAEALTYRGTHRAK